MLWFIRNVKNGDCFYFTFDREKHTVGRQGADLVLRNDQSISRTHACFYATNDTLTLEDSGSKYGTYLNGGIKSKKALAQEKPFRLVEGDQVRFGVMTNTWEVVKLPFVSMTSALNKDDAQQLEKYFCVLGGRVLPQWTKNCTHLTMSEITVTVKLLHALLEQIPIVNCNYWKDMVQHMHSEKSELPAPEKYLPQPSKTLMSGLDADLRCRPERKRVFAGMTFVFMNNSHHERYASIVQKAGGSCKNYTSAVKNSFLIKPKVVVIQYMGSTETQSLEVLDNVEETLEEHSLRTIAEYEIGLAIIQCSTEKYCNPRYSILHELMPSTCAADSAEPNTLLVENTNCTDSDDSGRAPGLLVVETENVSSVPSEMIISNASTLNDRISSQASPCEVAESNEEDEESMPRMYVTESMQSESDNKRKRSDAITPADHSGDNIQDDCFLFSKKQRLDEHANTSSENISSSEKPTTSKKPSPVTKTRQSNKKAPPKSRLRPLPIVTTSKRTMSGFLEKPQQVSADQTLTEHIKAKTPTQTGKRTRIDVLNDEDDDEDVFAFSSQKSNTKRACMAAPESEQANEDLFGFKTTQMDCVDTSDVVDVDKEEQTAEEAPAQNINKPKRKERPMPKPKLLPAKISIEGWLDCSRIKLEDAREQDEKVKLEGDSDDKDALHKQWIDGLKDVFHVQPLSLPLRTKSSCVRSETEVSMSGTGENYKRFKKKNLCHPQRTIIRTISIPIGGRLL